MTADIPEGGSEFFTTTVGLITTSGSLGPNVMAAEWTYLVSYRPMRILVVINANDATYKQIQETGEFGVSLCTDRMAAQASFAGHYSKHQIDKLSSGIFETAPTRKIAAPLIAGALLTAECRVVAVYNLGDHMGVLGEVLVAGVDDTRRPLILHSRSGYHQLGPQIEKAHEVAIAVTPMVAQPGTRLAFVGRLTGPGTAGTSVDILVIASGDRRLGHVLAPTDARGYFESGIALPVETPLGAAVVEGRHGDVVGRASLMIEGSA